MDDYPRNLAPEFEESGAVATSFDEWWTRVRHHFPNVPEEVAKYWLHEHWSHSPYAFLKSSEHIFTRVTWDSEKLFEIKTNWNDFSDDMTKCLWRGKKLVEDRSFGRLYKTTPYMLEHKDFPTPPIILDNRDGHIGENTARNRLEILPEAYVLVEGHRRFDIALYLIRTRRFKSQVDIWLMSRKEVQSYASTPR